MYGFNHNKLENYIFYYLMFWELNIFIVTIYVYMKEKEI